MKKVIITSDGACDLSKEIVEKYDIKVIPMPITMGTGSYLDGVDATALDVFKFFETTGELAKTSATPVATYEEIFKNYSTTPRLLPKRLRVVIVWMPETFLQESDFF